MAKKTLILFFNVFRGTDQSEKGARFLRTVKELEKLCSFYVLFHVFILGEAT